MNAKQLYEIARAEIVPTKTKRVIFNMVRFVFKMLFGTMDSDYAEYYNEKIRTIDSNQQYIY